MTRPDTILLYGETDTGKTSQLGALAAWLWEKFREITLLVSADSGWKSIPGSLLAGGVVVPWNVSGLKDPWAPLDAVVSGEWPSVVASPEGPRLRMVPLERKDGRVLLGGKVVGLVAFEGISTLGNVGLQDHIKTGRQLGQDLVGKFTSKVPEEGPGGKTGERAITLAKAAPSHYGQVQDWILLDLVPKSSSLPVRYVVWTGHEAKGKDDITGQDNSVLGPATVGRATVDRTVQKFGFAFHLTSETVVDPKGLLPIKREFRAWFVKHPDPVLTRMSWPTKVGLAPEESAELFRRFPKGYIPLGKEKGLEQFLEYLLELGGGEASSGPSGSEAEGPFF